MAKPSRSSSQASPRLPKKPIAQTWPFLLAAALAAILVVYLALNTGRQNTNPASPTPDPRQPAVAADDDRASSANAAFHIEPQQEVFARYAGSASCRECHVQAYEDWMTSNHFFAERAPDASLDQAAFVPPQTVADGAGTALTLATNQGYAVQIDATDNPTDSNRLYQVRRVIGHDPLRQFLVEAPHGRLLAFGTAWDPHAREWFDLFPGENRRPGEWGHWTGRGMTWNAMCASCHNTRLRKNYDLDQDRYHTAQAEVSVGCEACHSPLKDHVDYYRLANDSDTHPASPPPAIRSVTKTQMMDTCGTCHSRRYELTGDFAPGDTYFDHYALTIVDETELYYPDGQVREEDYVFASFHSSRMHAAGVTCLDCHQPHTSRPILPGNSLCMRCHSGGYPNSPVINPLEHSFHPPESSGAQCVNCHMPHTTYMQRHPRRDHGFTIPDPLLTRELGIPNACNRCHQDPQENTDWAVAAVEKWYGDKMQRPTRERARWIASARRGDPEARDRMLSLLQGDDLDYWKAVAANLLEPWAETPKVTEALIQAAAHSNALVRANALRSLAPLAGSAHGASDAQPGADRVHEVFHHALNDNIRSVRFQAAWTLRAEVNLDSLAGSEMRWALDYNADQPTGQMQLGALALSRNRPEEALGHYQKAVEWDPYSAPLRHELAVVHSLLGQPAQALAEMQEACRLDPSQAEYQYKLGLAWNETGNLHEVAAALERAVGLDPQHGRAWYNLGLARHRLGRSEEGIEALLRAETVLPNDPGIPYARATILAQLGRYDEARQAARRALETDQTYTPAHSLLRQLPGSSPGF